MDRTTKQLVLHKGPSITSDPNRTPSTQNESSTPAYVRAIFMRLDKIEKSLETIQSMLKKDMGSDNPEMEGLTRPLKTPAELKEASEKLRDADYRKKLIDYLSLLGGTTPGDTVRRIMRQIGTNGLWANYSLKGRKGKKKCEDLAMYPVIVPCYFSCSVNLCPSSLCALGWAGVFSAPPDLHGLHKRLQSSHPPPAVTSHVRLRDQSAFAHRQGHESREDRERRTRDLLYHGTQPTCTVHVTPPMEVMKVVETLLSNFNSIYSKLKNTYLQFFK
ncbi:hypothetical protein JOQ06_015053 [Pogonophryne albipinna]|uniref:DUF4806 domain-containing protein n=1 Tax=Pogonophryne albipinna TaxID=1090488 RepID=A0AAD6AKV1_9TELE|nr:hypothetical protein JOQ06_015053 [Pogonophryne albipinna]